MQETPNTVEKPEDFGKDPSSKVRYWCTEIEHARKRFKGWEERAEKVLERYRGEKKAAHVRFNILWSNTETLKPAVYNKPPVPIAKRRYGDKDPVARQAAEIVERTLLYMVDAHDFDGVMRRVVEDYVLPGRGIARVAYKPTFGMVPHPVEPNISMDEMGMPAVSYPEGTQFDDQGNAYQEVEQVVDEEARSQHWAYSRFLHGEGESWDDVPWIAFESLYDRQMLVDEFGKIGYKIKLDVECEREKFSSSDQETVIKKTKIVEIWDKRTRKRIFICMSYKERPLKEDDDPLGLDNFFPCPRPIYGVVTNNTLEPIPEYCLYQDLAEELETVTERISKLTENCKAAGIYDAVAGHIKRIMQESEDGELVPVEGFNPSMPLEQQVMWFPIEQIAKVLAILSKQREAIKQVIYDVTGIADIVRGASNPNETATAQRIKGQFATLRLDHRQAEVARFARDLLRLMAEIISEHFSAETLQMITGLEVSPEVMQLIKTDIPRNFHIDIETDSTIAADEEAEKQQIVELVKAVSEFTQVAPAMANTLGVEFVKELLLTVFRRFRMGRSLEDVLEQSMAQVQQAQQQQPPSEAEIQAQTEQQKLQFEQQKHQQEMEFKMQVEEASMQTEQQKQQDSIAIEQSKQQMQLEIERSKQELMLEMEREKQQLMAELEAQKAEDAIALEKYKFDREIELKRELGVIDAAINAHNNEMMAAQAASQADKEGQEPAEEKPTVDMREISTLIKTALESIYKQQNVSKKVSIIRDAEGNLQGGEITAMGGN
jgi:hypothetical protein